MSVTVPAAGPSQVARGRAYRLSGRARLLGATACGAVVVGLAAWAMMPGKHTRPNWGGATTPWSMGADYHVPAQEAAAAPAVAPPPPPPASAAKHEGPNAPPLPTVRPMGFWADADADKRNPPQQTRGPSAPGGDMAAVPGGAQSDYAARMQTTSFGNVTPAPLHLHPMYTIAKGTTFPCLPSQPISSELPGPVKCRVTEPVYSMDGSTVLLPEGTQVNGQIERGLGTGDQRLFLVWTDALTPAPDLLAIPLDAPAADEMGQVGVPGDIKDHFWKKLKMTAAVSAIQMLTGLPSALAGQGNHNTSLNFGGNLGTQGQSLAEMAFQHDMNIPTTLYRGPAQPLSVYINKYVDMSLLIRNVVVR